MSRDSIVSVLQAFSDTSKQDIPYRNLKLEVGPGLYESIRQAFSRELDPSGVIAEFKLNFDPTQYRVVKFLLPGIGWVELSLIEEESINICWEDSPTPTKS